MLAVAFVVVFLAGVAVSALFFNKVLAAAKAKAADLEAKAKVAAINAVNKL